MDQGEVRKPVDVKGKRNRLVEVYELTGIFSVKTKEHISIALLCY